MTSLCILFSVFTIPFNLAFPELQETSYNYNFVSRSVDVIFLIDIFLTFLKVTEKEDELEDTLEDDLKTLAKNYIKSWLLVDIISIFPFDLILDAL